MAKIFCVIGKSATGKDSIYKKLLEDKTLGLKRMIPYTTRPIREGEKEGKEYHFCSEEDVLSLERDGKIVELRQYNTVYGIWKYFTVNDGSVNLEENNYLLIVTLEGYEKIRNYFGTDKTVPIYVEVEDGERLLRAIAREQQEEIPKYEEMCRRFLADSKDFSEENLKKLEIEKRFFNEELEDTIRTIAAYIKEQIQ